MSIDPKPKKCIKAKSPKSESDRFFHTLKLRAIDSLHKKPLKTLNKTVKAHRKSVLYMRGAVYLSPSCTYWGEGRKFGEF